MSDVKKIRDYKKSRLPKPEVSEAEHRRNVEDMFDLLAPIIEKVQKLPPVPVSESLDELMLELQSGGKRQPLIVHHHTGEQIKYNSDGTQERLTSSVAASVLVAILESDTKHKSGGDTFTDSEKLILEQLKK